MKTDGKIITTEWRKWLVSDEGKTSSNLSTLPKADVQYLENRLWRAFQAGVKAAEAAAPKSPIVNRKS